VVKNAAPLEDYVEGRPIEKGALVYEGTTVIQGSWAKKTVLFPDNEGVPVLVTRTNFLTTKGQLIRMILFPK
jgi:magnesium-transporting ATPase (P-type)